MEESNGPFIFKFGCFEKIRDGRHGPVFRVLDTSFDTPTSGRMMAAERLNLEEPALQKALSSLEQKPDPERRSYAVVNYIGYQRHEGHTYLLTDCVNGEPIRDVMRLFGGHFGAPDARKVLRDVVRGLREAYDDLGFSVVFLDAEEIWIDGRTVAKIDVTYLDTAITGQQPFRPSALTVPEMVFGRTVGGDLRKADIWLLGVVAAQLLAKRADPLIPDFAAAAAVAARILEQGQTGSGLELLLPEHADMLPKNPQALDFVQRCLAMNREERPTLNELWDHPFLAMAEVEGVE
jgi:serine/threonine protein kinase